MGDNEKTVLDFMETVWNGGDIDAVERFVAERYVIHSDPGDPWDGQALDIAGFKQRLTSSRASFPDLRFHVGDVMGIGNRVVLTWIMRGTNTGPIAGRPATGKTIAVRGLTIYYLTDGRIAGHTQVVDRLSVLQQLGFVG